MQPLVAINCIAYNQEKYIRETLEGFIMQKTDFPFVAVVHDDASTDHTADIIREYAEQFPNIIKPIFETENQYSKPGKPLGKIMLNAINETGAEFVAYCEGDDYWIDNLKLQKQVDFLKSHPDYSLCCSNADEFIQNENRLKIPSFKPYGTFGLEHIICQNDIYTCSVLIRRDLLNIYYSDVIPKFPSLSFGDYPLWLHMATLGKCQRLKDTMSIYRICNSGVSNIKGAPWMHSRLTVLDFFTNNYNIDKTAKERAQFNFFRIWAYFATTQKDVTVYQRAIQYYDDNGYFWTKLFLKLAWRFPRGKRLWSFLNAHNHIKPKSTDSFGPYITND